MARGNNNRGRGASRGSSRGQPFPGRGGRGGRGGVRGRGRGNGRGIPPMDDYDFAVQMWPDDLTYNGTPRGRGRGRGRGSYPSSGRDTPAIRGTDSPRGRGSFRGRGRGDANDGYSSPLRRGRPSRGQLNSKLRAGAPLSKLLYEDRPLLKPITFVRSVYMATLFQQEEDILQPIVEPVADDDESHVPTADQVTRVFDGGIEGEDGENGSGDEEQLEEIDFTDVGKMQAEVDAIAATMTHAQTQSKATKETFSGFYVDTTPTPVVARPAPLIAADRMEGALGDDDEEIIVYVAPHPRISLSRAATPAPVTEAVETLTTMSILTGRELTQSQTTETTSKSTLASVPEAEVLSEARWTHENAQEFPMPDAESGATESAPSVDPPSLDSISFSFETSRKRQARKLFPVGGPRSLLQRSKKPRRRTPRHLGAFGAAVSEAQLQREGRARDPREPEQRRGDSDVNFGESSDDEIQEVSTGIGAMDLDANAEISVEAMKSFVKSMSAEGSRHITMDDIADEERMKAEDAEQRGWRDGDVDDSEENEDVEDGREDEDRDLSDEEMEAVIHAAEQELIGEDSEERASDEDDDEDEDDEDVSSDDGQSPRAGFQARLARMRVGQNGQKNVKGKGRQVEGSSDEDMEINVTWADEDEDFIAEIQEMLDANADILSNGDRRARKKLFRAIENGDFEDDEFAVMMKPAGRKNDRHIPPELCEQWEKDRQKKAENKRKRREDILAAAADPLAVHKGGKKGRKAMLAAARLESHIEVENRVVDFVSLEAQIRRFLFDIGGKDSMVLPPCDKATRKRIHELADAFNLKSQSKGKGMSRYTTLIKTSKSGLGINEKKVKRILRTNKDNTWDAPDGGRGKGKGRIHSLAKHREGEEVGKAAPKIGESNIGFRMLASMGWAEGDRIGLSGGLDAPLVAKMKKTKLGLGATM